jgi:transposase
MKFKEYNQEQPWLIPPNIEDEIPADDLCRVINDIVDVVDISSIELKYKEEGNTAYHPRMMLKSLYYSYSQKIFSSRKIAKEYERNIFYWYLSGNQRPDFRTISLFRRKHSLELKEVFIEITKLCIKLGLVGFKTTAIDGTKIRANASMEKFRDAAWLEHELAALNGIDDAIKEAERIDKEEDELYGKENRGDELPKEVADEKARRLKLKELQKELKEQELKKINQTDPEAKIMKSQGGYLPAYNCQAMVDEKNQVILSAEVIDSPNDWYQIKPRIEDGKEEYGQAPEVVLADTGYGDGPSIGYLHEEKIDGYIPDKTPKKIKAELENRLPDDMKYKKDQFSYDEEKDVYICPEGTELVRTSNKMQKAPRKKNEESKFHTYQCFNNKCPRSTLCHNAKAGRRIYRHEDQHLRDLMAKKIRTNDGWETYSARMKIIEPVFANIKYNLGFLRFSLRGKSKVNGEFFIVVCIHNMKKIAKYLQKNHIASLKTALQGS